MKEQYLNESSSNVVKKKKRKNITKHTKNVLFIFFLGLGLCHSFSPSTKHHSVKSNTIDILLRKKLSSRSRRRSRLFSTTIEKNIQSATSTTFTNDQEMLLQSLHSDIYGSLFINKVRELLEFKNAHDGSCLVPKRYKENPSLGEL